MIRLVNLSKYYNSANTVVPALRRISLEFSVGEFIAITGESGSGKSTLLNVISGFDTYDDGELYIQGEETSHYDSADWEEYRKNRIGFIFQNYNLIDNYSALYNVESSLLIQGYSNTEANRKAKELLHRVGLDDFINQRAGRLSSGQKQRLSIARALAKDTDIIVADEPTGNLDSENGKQIMELFKSLSKDKLVIVVTHNFEESAPYATRKIRLHDGEVVSDTPIIPQEPEALQKQLKESDDIKKDNNEISKGADKNNAETKSSEQRIAMRFALMNITTQPRRVLLLLMFLLFCTAVSFLFLGEIFSNWDDIFTKTYDDTAFANSDTTRIVVMKPDRSIITEEDLQVFNRIKYVEMADGYGFANDINYYIEFETDYEYVYRPSDRLQATEQSKEVKFLKNDRFLRSSSCIIEKDLSAGRLPTEQNEIVLYSADVNDIGKEQLCYFTSKNTWGSDQYCSYVVKVVGILKNENDQIFFSEEMCNMLSLDLYGDSYQLNLCYNMLKAMFMTEAPMIPITCDQLTNREVRVSEDLVLSSGYSAPGSAEIEICRDSDGTIGEVDEVLGALVLPEFNNHSPIFVEVSEDLFSYLFPYESRQASLFIRDYIHTDYVLKKLAEQGYDAISTFRTSSVKYDPIKVADRSTIILKSLIVLGIIGILEIIIIRTMFHIRSKDFILLGSMGMSHKAIKWMNLYEVYLFTAAGVVLVPVIVTAASLFGSSYLVNMLKYYNFKTFLIYIIMNFIIITAAIGSFNRYLKRRQKWSRHDKN